MKPNVENVGDVGEQVLRMINVRQVSEREESLNEIIKTEGGLAPVTKRSSSWLETLLYQESFGR